MKHRPLGSNHGMAKINEQDAAQIKELIAMRDRHLEEARKLTYASIGEKFGIQEATVRNIANGRNWSHV
jgi:hypothetical protein